MSYQTRIKSLIDTNNQLTNQVYSQTPNIPLSISQPQRPIPVSQWMASQVAGTGDGGDWFEGLVEWWNDVIGGLTENIGIWVFGETGEGEQTVTYDTGEDDDDGNDILQDVNLINVPFAYIKNWWDDTYSPIESTTDGHDETELFYGNNTFFARLFRGILSSGSELVDGITRWAETLVKGITDWWENIPDIADLPNDASGLDIAFSHFKGVGDWLFKNVAIPVQEWWDDTFTPASGFTIDAFDSSTDTVTGNEFIDRIFHFLINAPSAFLTGLGTAITDISNSILDWVSEWEEDTRIPEDDLGTGFEYDDPPSLNQLVGLEDGFTGNLIPIRIFRGGINWWNSLIVPGETGFSAQDSFHQFFGTVKEIAQPVFQWLADWESSTRNESLLYNDVNNPTFDELIGTADEFKDNRIHYRIIRGIFNWWEELPATTDSEFNDINLFDKIFATIKQIGAPIFEWFARWESDTRSEADSQYVDEANPTLEELISNDNAPHVRIIRGVINWWTDLDDDPSMEMGLFNQLFATIKNIGKPIFDWFSDLEYNTRAPDGTGSGEVDYSSPPTFDELTTDENVWWKRAFRGITNWWNDIPAVADLPSDASLVDIAFSHFKGIGNWLFQNVATPIFEWWDNTEGNDFVEKAWNGIIGIGHTVIDGILDVLLDDGMDSTNVLEHINRLWNGITTGATQFADDVLEGLGEIWEYLDEHIITPVKEWWEGTTETGTNPDNTIPARVWRGIYALGAGTGAVIVDSVTDGLDWAFETGSEVWDYLVDNATNFTNDVVTKLKEGITWINESVSVAWTNLVAGATDFAGDITAALDTAWTDLTTFIGDISTQVLTAIFGEDLTENVINGIESIGIFWGGLTDDVKTAAEGLMEDPLGWLSNRPTEILNAVFTNAHSFIDKVLDTLLDDNADSTNAIEHIERVWNKITGLAGFGDDVIDAVDNAVETLTLVGADIAGWINTNFTEPIITTTKWIADWLNIGGNVASTDEVLTRIIAAIFPGAGIVTGVAAGLQHVLFGDEEPAEWLEQRGEEIQTALDDGWTQLTAVTGQFVFDADLAITGLADTFTTHIGSAVDTAIDALTFLSDEVRIWIETSFIPDVRETLEVVWGWVGDATDAGEWIVSQIAGGLYTGATSLVEGIQGLLSGNTQLVPSVWAEEEADGQIMEALENSGSIKTEISSEIDDAFTDFGNTLQSNLISNITGLQNILNEIADFFTGGSSSGANTTLSNLDTTSINKALIFADGSSDTGAADGTNSLSVSSIDHLYIKGKVGRNIYQRINDITVTETRDNQFKLHKKLVFNTDSAPVVGNYGLGVNADGLQINSPSASSIINTIQGSAIMEISSNEVELSKKLLFGSDSNPGNSEWGIGVSELAQTGNSFQDMYIKTKSDLFIQSGGNTLFVADGSGEVRARTFLPIMSTTDTIGRHSARWSQGFFNDIRVYDDLAVAGSIQIGRHTLPSNTTANGEIRLNGNNVEIYSGGDWRSATDISGSSTLDVDGLEEILDDAPIVSSTLSSTLDWLWVHKGAGSNGTNTSATLERDSIGDIVERGIRDISTGNAAIGNTLIYRSGSSLGRDSIQDIFNLGFSDIQTNLIPDGVTRNIGSSSDSWGTIYANAFRLIGTGTPAALGTFGIIGSDIHVYSGGETRNLSDIGSGGTPTLLEIDNILHGASANTTPALTDTLMFFDESSSGDPIRRRSISDILALGGGGTSTLLEIDNLLHGASANTTPALTDTLLFFDEDSGGDPIRRRSISDILALGSGGDSDLSAIDEDILPTDLTNINRSPYDIGASSSFWSDIFMSKAYFRTGTSTTTSTHGSIEGGSAGVQFRLPANSSERFLFLFGTTGHVSIHENGIQLETKDSDPSNPAEGTFWYNGDDAKFKFRQGSGTDAETVTIGGGGGSADFSDISEDLIPNASQNLSAYDLGSLSKYWENLYIKKIFFQSDSTATTDTNKSEITATSTGMKFIVKPSNDSFVFTINNTPEFAVSERGISFRARENDHDAPFEGSMWYNTTENKFKFRQGNTTDGETVTIGGGGGGDNLTIAQIQPALVAAPTVSPATNDYVLLSDVSTSPDTIKRASVSSILALASSGGSDPSTLLPTNLFVIKTSNFSASSYDSAFGDEEGCIGILMRSSNPDSSNDADEIELIVRGEDEWYHFEMDTIQGSIQNSYQTGFHSLIEFNPKKKIIALDEIPSNPAGVPFEANILVDHS